MRNGILFLCLFVFACTSNPFKDVQGAYSASKESIRELVNSTTDKGGGLLGALMERVIENAIFEMRITGDSISGLIFLAGESTVINGVLEVENDTIYVVNQGNAGKKSAYLMPGANQLIYVNAINGTQITLDKKEDGVLSEETTKAIAAVQERDRERKEFLDNLGVWQVGNFVDEFGDDTGDSFWYTIVEGTKKNNRRTTSDPVYVKATISSGALYFSIFDESLNYKENMPDSKFGRIAIKKESGEVVNQEVFFFEGGIHEREGNDMMYRHLQEDRSALRVLIDLSKINEYMDDTYQFSISQGNLLEAAM